MKRYIISSHMKLLLLFSFLFFFSGLMAQNECGPATGYTGTSKEVYPNGSKKEENTYLNGVKHGVCLSFYLDGTLRSKEKYQLGRLEEILQKPDSDHDQRDHRLLYPVQHTSNTGSSQKNSPPSLWTEKRTQLNDSTWSVKWYYKNKLYEEQKTINGELRYQRQYHIDEELFSDKNRTNINYEAYKYGGRLHGKTTSWHNNGNIDCQREYRYDEPVGMHYIYYNQASHPVKSITCYTDPDLMGDYYTSKIGSITKYYDTTAKCTGYQVMYGGRASKLVSFTDKQKVHTWSVQPGYEDELTVEGIVEEGEYRITNVFTKNRKHLIKQGNGKYDARIAALTDVIFQIPDTISLPEGVVTHTEWTIKAPEANLVSGPRKYFFVYESDGRDFEMLTVPWERWKGKIANGFLTGEWKMEGKAYLNRKLTTDISFHGNFERSRRNGPWIYETDYYRCTLNYRDGKKEGMMKVELKKYDMSPFSRAALAAYRSRGETGDGLKSDLPDVYDNLLSLWVGAFVNNEMHGEWLAYYRYPDQLAFKAVFNNGVFLAKTEEYNLKQQLVAKRQLQGNRIIEEKLYTPLGEEYERKYLNIYEKKYLNTYQKKYASDYYEISSPYLIESNAINIYHGRYLQWSNYTGSIHKKGAYINGRKNGEWLSINSGDTLIEHYIHDTLDGFYKRHRGIHPGDCFLNAGFFSKGKKSGLWKQDNTRDSLFTEEIFMDNERYLMTYTIKNKTCVKQGEGMIPKKVEGIMSTIEEYYKGGSLFKTVVYYSHTNEIASIVFTTPHGDSLAYYMPPESGTCVKNGTGMRTYFDHKSRIYGIDYYVAGKLIKYDRYEEGRFSGTDYFHYVSDTTDEAKEQLFFEKEATRSFSGLVKATMRVKNIPKNTSMMYFEGFNLGGSEIEISHPDYFTIKEADNKKLVLTSVKWPVPNEVSITYKNANHWMISGRVNLQIDTKNWQTLKISLRHSVKK